MSKWSEYYLSRLGNSYKQYVAKRYKPFVDILNNTGATTYAEFGCGIGTITCLINKGKHILIDRDLDILNLAEINTCYRHLYIQSNIKDIEINKVDVIHSHGVLEHLDNKTILDVVAKQKKSSKIGIHYVPTDKYTTKSFGDERLMSVETWCRLVKPKETILFNDDKDLILIV